MVADPDYCGLTSFRQFDCFHAEFGVVALYLYALLVSRGSERIESNIHGVFERSLQLKYSENRYFVFTRINVIKNR